MSLYTFADTTRQTINKFRFASARAKNPQALILKIAKTDQVISIDPFDDDTLIISSIDDLRETLPENAPRLVLLSYPHVLPDGRLTAPYVMLYFRPPTASQTLLMSYAGAVELIRNESNVSRVIEFEDEDDLDDIEALLF
ncbi:uncharacterized protein SAPINGB_P004998 [Magnusiomyces paraingens]|uniref:ADF-H domain-containing protein n=1 Tax=Magnusiomyces paraingens TaxID=2606893 RepID=A0A5E8BY05_9ASCO|nr:uncharacterized protein SAPINGB_P004998 [Saprochaete ingens]VVT56354.1 unnamed protein product [Saprochaete ingens]